MTISYQD